MDKFELKRVINTNGEYQIRMTMKSELEYVCPPYVYIFKFRDLDLFIHQNVYIFKFRQTPKGEERQITGWQLPWTVSEKNTGLAVLKGSFFTHESKQKLAEQAIDRLTPEKNYEYVKTMILANKNSKQEV